MANENLLSKPYLQGFYRPKERPHRQIKAFTIEISKFNSPVSHLWFYAIKKFCNVSVIPLLKAISSKCPISIPSKPKIFFMLPGGKEIEKLD